MTFVRYQRFNYKYEHVSEITYGTDGTCNQSYQSNLIRTIVEHRKNFKIAYWIAIGLWLWWIRLAGVTAAIRLFVGSDHHLWLPIAIQRQ